ncbi:MULTISPECIES: acyl-CoA synthetase [Streptomycetaceae]|uniref:Acyl-CoA synthetase n=1 Tax=Streptantibioticus cattleyicolor (strain ATCC 35852 / DSM 46488 / JCM 4925 / NBRC 14057 / NRRL 8057) TaxID=1003195 RepID=F8JV47_STREN|nr:acyl-CoA synthetase [Streptantibioticus cattleyicolor]AEW93128.1 acyl-CoA synthetase [Streptantibioticus cattleyicolor NRRL 8057 = DSM 46488]MYS57856.1 AMP-binding protein [Streptomyces sp. SID5468]CCB73487.1 FadD-like protein [Streptantibioticus cattleyicolor NRRL 8057 = DSM 46488]
MEYNLADLFESVVDVVPDREALVYADHPGTGAERRLTYAELDAAANRLAHHLAGQGVAPGDHVGLHLYNGVEYLQTTLACLKIRAVPVNVNYRYVEDELAHLYRDADLVALVYDAEFADRVATAAARAPRLRHRLRVGGTGPEAVSFADAEAQGSPGRDFAPRSADDQLVIYTGGTTGLPKGVMWRSEDLFFAGLGGGAPTGIPVSRPEELAERVAAGGEGLVFFPAPPLMHGTATLTAFIAFFFGQKVVLHRRYAPEEVLRTVERERVTSLALVGDAMLRPLADALAGPLKGTDCSSLLSLSSSGAVLSRTVREQFQTLVPQVLILNNFGSSESGFNGTATDESGAGEGFRLRVNSRTAVVDPVTHRPVAPGVPGRLAQRGHVPLGYYNDPVKTAETFLTDAAGERWVLLGDMATVDAEGVVTVLGRGSQCINTGGEKVFPEEVEEVLKAHPDVYDALVAGVPHERWGSQVTAVVQPRPGTEVTLCQLQEHCRDRLAGYKIPRVLVVTGHIRRSPSGKADYGWARQVAARAAGR